MKKLFRRKYCKSCYSVEYYREKYLECAKELYDVKSKYDKNDKLIQKLNSVIKNNEHLLYMSDNGFITLRQRFDDYGILRYLDFNGYFINEIYERSIPQRLYVSVEKDIRERYVKSFYIIDFLCNPRNKGYGSIMMEQFLKYIQQFNAEFVSGFLSFVDTQDENHKELLYHFYQKFGFEIDEKENIKLNLHAN